MKQAEKKTIELTASNFELIKNGEERRFNVDGESIFDKLVGVEVMTAIITGDGVKLRFETDA